MRQAARVYQICGGRAVLFGSLRKGAGTKRSVRRALFPLRRQSVASVSLLVAASSFARLNFFSLRGEEKERTWAECCFPLILFNCCSCIHEFRVDFVKAWPRCGLRAKVGSIQEKSTSLMDADDRFRRLQAKACRCHSGCSELQGEVFCPPESKGQVDLPNSCLEDFGR